MAAINKIKKETKNCIQYVGIAYDEPKRFHNLSKTKISPLVELKWTEADCYKWSENNNLLSPTYKYFVRDGCWFCYNARIEQLRNIYHNYPEYWKLMLKWDNDSPVTFRPDGHTIHDYDKRFELEDKKLIPADRKFRWKMIEK